MRKKLKIGILISLLFLVGACSSNNKLDCDAKKYKKNPVATIDVKGYGKMEFELEVNKAPQSVSNFVELANKKYYNGLVFHRLDQDLGIIQGGDPTGTGGGGPGYTIEGEFTENKHCNDLRNEEGTIAMARGEDFNSAGSQFYLNFKNNTQIFKNNYTVFGKIIKGQDILAKFSKLATKMEENGTNAPATKIEINSITVDTFGQEMPKLNKLTEK